MERLARVGIAESVGDKFGASDGAQQIRVMG
jgi:hypothetical protein